MRAGQPLNRAGGSWSNSAKEASNRKVPFPHFYVDYAGGIFASSIAWWIILGGAELDANFVRRRASLSLLSAHLPFAFLSRSARRLQARSSSGGQTERRWAGEAGAGRVTGKWQAKRVQHRRAQH